mmetsp:Transcript_16843/g.18530  ORF Transcript_16843/g.18530 Transcript_16843/m.18530 type:complete len:80 (-) Transcript_16843:65-304(-)
MNMKCILCYDRKVSGTSTSTPKNNDTQLPSRSESSILHHHHHQKPQPQPQPHQHYQQHITKTRIYGVESRDVGSNIHVM